MVDSVHGIDSVRSDAFPGVFLEKRSFFRGVPEPSFCVRMDNIKGNLPGQWKRGERVVWEKQLRGSASRRILTVMALAVVVGALLLPGVRPLVHRAESLVDGSSLRTLNLATAQYAQANRSGEPLFAGLKTDNDRMDTLVAEGYLEAPVVPRQEQAGFYWNAQDGLWEKRELLGARSFRRVLRVDLERLEEHPAAPGTRWTRGESGLVIGEGAFFVPLGRPTYDLTVRLGAGPSSGEARPLGVWFDAVLAPADGNSEDPGKAGVQSAGYVLVYRPELGIPSWEIRRMGWGETRGTVLLVVAADGGARGRQMSGAKGLRPHPEEVRLEIRTAEDRSGEKVLRLTVDGRELVAGWRYRPPARTGSVLYGGLEGGSALCGFTGLDVR